MDAERMSDERLRALVNGAAFNGTEEARVLDELFTARRVVEAAKAMGTQVSPALHAALRAHGAGEPNETSSGGRVERQPAVNRPVSDHGGCESHPAAPPSPPAPRAAAQTAEDRADEIMLPWLDAERDAALLTCKGADTSKNYRASIAREIRAAAQRAREEAQAESDSRARAAQANGVEMGREEAQAEVARLTDERDMKEQRAEIAEDDRERAWAEVARLRDDLDIARGDERLAQAAIARLKRKLAARPPWPAAKARAAEAALTFASAAVCHFEEGGANAHFTCGCVQAARDLGPALRALDAEPAAAGGEAGDVAKVDRWNANMERDRLWCMALVKALDGDTDLIAAVTNEFNKARGLPRNEAT